MHRQNAHVPPVTVSPRMGKSTVAKSARMQRLSPNLHASASIPSATAKSSNRSPSLALHVHARSVLATAFDQEEELHRCHNRSDNTLSPPSHRLHWMTRQQVIGRVELDEAIPQCAFDAALNLCMRSNPGTKQEGAQWICRTIGLSGCRRQVGHPVLKNHHRGSFLQASKLGAETSCRDPCSRRYLAQSPPARGIRKTHSRSSARSSTAARYTRPPIRSNPGEY